MARPRGQKATKPKTMRPIVTGVHAGFIVQFAVVIAPSIQNINVNEMVSFWRTFKNRVDDFALLSADQLTVSESF